MTDTILEATCAILAERGPLDENQLRDALRSQLARTGDPEALLRDVLENHDEITSLPDGRHADTVTLIDGLTLTHRLTLTEARTGVIPLDPDLEGLDELQMDGFELADGQRLDVVFDARAPNGGLSGPPGWLRDAQAGDVLAFRHESGRLDIGKASIDETHTGVHVRALREAYDALREAHGTVFTTEVVCTALAGSPGLFKQPVLPLSELLKVAGLEQEVDRTFDPADEGPDDGPTMRDVLRNSYGLDECCVEAVSLLMGALELSTREDLAEGGAELLRPLGKALGHGDAAQVFATLALRPFGPATVRAFVEALIGHARRTNLAAAHFVLAVCAEWATDDPIGGEGHIADALRADPGFGPALYDAAWYAEDRGDAVRATSFMRRAGADADDPALERLQQFSSPVMAGVSRNAACLCGSGRKYKQCCGARNGLSPADHARWLLQKAVHFAMRGPQRALTYDIVQTRYGDDTADPQDVALSVDAFAINLALFDEGLLERFLDVRGPLLPACELELGRRWTACRHAAYAVVDVRPGEGLTLRDARTVESLLVNERAGSRILREGDWILAVVLPEDGGHLVAGGAFKLPLRLREPVLSLLDPEPDGFDIAEWIGAAEAPPQLRTMESEPVVFCKATYRVNDAISASAALGEVLETDDGREFTEYTEVRGERYVRGWIRIDADELVVETNSVERLERLEQVVESAVPGAQFVDETRTPLEQALAEHRPGEVELPEPTPEMLALLEQKIVEYERRWVDESIPALGGLTPRQALDDPTRRGDLLTLLREFDERPGMMNPARLRELLGLERADAQQ
jgi:hypothetical protein